MKVIFILSLALMTTTLSAKNMSNKLIYEYYDGHTRLPYEISLLNQDVELETYFLSVNWDSRSEEYVVSFNAMISNDDASIILNTCENIGNRLEYFPYQGQQVLTCRIENYSGDTFFGGSLMDGASVVWVGGPSWTNVFKVIQRKVDYNGVKILYSVTLKDIQ